MRVQNKPMQLTKQSLQDVFTEKEFKTLQEILLNYKEFQSELYDYPDEDTLFTDTQLNLFSAFDIDSF
jgi:hypothetical protein